MKYNLRKVSKPIAFIVAFLFFTAQLPAGFAVAEDKKSGEWVAKSLAAFQAGKYDEAVRFADQAIQIDPKDEDAYNARGLAYYGKGQKEFSIKAIADYDMAIKLKPDFAVAYMNRGNAKTDLEQYDSNIEDQTRAIQLSPKMSRAYSARAAAYHRKKMYDKAIEDYDRSLELSSKDGEAYCGRGNSYYRSGKYDQAIKDYDQAISLQPGNADFYRLRGRAYLKTGAYDKTLVDCIRSLEINPNLSKTRSYKGDAHLAQGEYDLAIKEYNRSIELDPKQTDQNSYFGRGMAFKAKGQLQEAIADLKKAVENAPENEEYKKELATMGGLSVAQQIPAPVQAPADLPAAQNTPPLETPASTPAADVSGGNASLLSNTTAPSNPAPSPAGGARVMAPFTGYAVADMCNQVNTKLSGVPWREGEAAGGTVGAPQLGQYDSMLRHTMQGLRLLYGTLTPEEENSFNAFWAPFFDHPTATGLEYFQKINPLLDEMAVTLNNLDGMVAELGEGLQETLITVEDPGSAAPHVARATYESVKAERAKMDDLMKQITALGNPPNPLAAKCAARKRHKKAVVGEVDVLAAVKKADLFDNNFYMQLRTVGWFLSKESKGALVEWGWEGNTFHFADQNNTSEFNYNSPDCSGHYGPSHRHEITGTLSADGKMIEKVSYRSFSQYCDAQTKQIVGPKPEGSCEAVNIPLVSVDIKPDETKILYEVKGPEVSKHTAGVTGGINYDYQKPEELRFEFASGGHELTAEEAAKVVSSISSIFADLNGKGPAPTPAAKEPAPAAPAADQAKKDKTAPVDPESDPKVLNEAITQHVALAEQIRKDAQRWAGDADKETDPDRKKELLKRAGEMRANAQAEQDVADSIRTGTLVHTRTEWDEQQHQALVGSIQKELAVFDLESKMIANIPKVGDMIAGAEGVQLREEAQQRISEAIKSPDRLQKLAALYGELQNKVVTQGEQQMATEQAKVEMWDRRIAVAEGIQTAASTGIMLGALWAPTVVGSLALGYAGATGFAEDGVKGATVAVVRSVSSKADAVISAYEGATKIDPATGQPGGAWGAIEGALWSIGMNKGMEIAGGRIQKAKADYALAKQAAGGQGVKSVARATGEGRIKEYDFKTPEERYKTELEAAKTPEEKEAVNKKNAVQVEREAMNKEGEAALKKAEDAVLKGTDPAKAKEQYNKDLTAINDKYAAKETRNQEHKEVMEKLGFDPEKDIKPTGSDPKTAASDIDLTPQGNTPHEAYQKGKQYTEAMKERGHNVVEYGDRWVDTTTDATIWKPGFGADKPGSSSFEAEVIFGTLPHSDKFGTKGGIEWTSSASHETADPLGAVLANTGKAVGAGLGNSRPPDLHTVGKSAVKAAEAAGIDVDPQLKAQIDALKAHKTPEQAGIVDLGADQATKDKQVKTFLGRVQSLMGSAYRSAKAKSDANMKELEAQAKAAGDSDEGYKLRAQIKAYKAGNDAALTTISQVSPGLVATMAPPAKAADVVQGSSGGDQGNLNLGGLAKELFADRESALKAPPLSADSKDPVFAGLGERCKEGAKRVSDKLAAAKPGSEDALYLTELKAALAQGEKNPAEAVRTVRGVSGTELAVVLAQLGVKADPGKK